MVFSNFKNIFLSEIKRQQNAIAFLISKMGFSFCVIHLLACFKGLSFSISRFISASLLFNLCSYHYYFVNAFKSYIT